MLFSYKHDVGYKSGHCTRNTRKMNEVEEVQYIFKFSTLCALQFSSVAQLRPTLCNPMNRSTPGVPVHHHLLEFTQTHVHRAGDAIQPSHPLSSPSPPAPNPSQKVNYP